VTNSRRSSFRLALSISIPREITIRIVIKHYALGNFPAFDAGF
jgi:hypothetical protein